MNNVCLLSIIVPVYNVEIYIRACIESIFRQNLDEKCFEVIIVNDGTKDHSMEVIQDIINQHSNITVINQENLGLSVARNNGIAQAKGEYIFMPDSDDLLIDNSLSVLLEKAIASKVNLVVADYLEMTDEEIDKLTTLNQPQLIVQERKNEELYLLDLDPNKCYVWRTLYRRSFLVKNRISFVPGISCQDVPFTNECYLRSKKSMRTNLLLNIYRRRQMSATSFFNKRKCLDLCVAVAATWKLRNIEGLSQEMKQRLSDNVFVSFSLIFYVMLKGVISSKERREIFVYLNNLVPDLTFSHGIKQRVSTFLYKLSPAFYYASRRAYKELVMKLT